MFGKAITPLTDKLVVVTLVAETLVGAKVVAAKVVKKPFVEVSDVPSALENVNATVFKLVELALVNTPVLGVVAPIEVLLTVPPEIVSASTVEASEMLLTGKVTVPNAVRLPKNALVDETLVPVAEAKLSGPAKVPPANGK